ncbi:mercuric ion transport protein [Sphingomonas palmae]|uniref:Mercuric transport protein MerT n=1 Tax=Sphingomonas palmae TaxID=1855283 RepID=A0A1H7V852_9SPHN|nr:mercuric transporter MerT family protein [Sphingomonas palmae]SEM04927.1 mercuric ion transport protein [Sphingomonas palmae]
MNPSTAATKPIVTPKTSNHADTGLSTLGALAGVGAVLAAASCCVLPLAFAALGVGAGLSSTFTALLPLRWPLTALSIIGLAAGWWYYTRRWRACTADRSCTTPLPSRMTPIVLAIGSALTLIALVWDHVEAPLMKALS